MSSFGKIRVDGRGALDLLQLVCANQIDVADGRIVYTQMLNERGGIEADLTVTRLGETTFLVVVPAATLQRDLAWLRRHAGELAVTVLDVSAGEAVLPVMGPKARDLLALVSPDDFSNAAHPFGTAREVEIGMGLARAHRVSFVGELGWELYVSADQAAHVFETLVEAGTEVGLKICGLHAMDSARIEKAYRHFGHDITDGDHVLEAGLGFAVRTGKPASLAATPCCAARKQGSRAGCCSSGSPTRPLLFHGEPILRDGLIVRHLTSGTTATPWKRRGPWLCALHGNRGDVESMLTSPYAIEVAGEPTAPR